MIRRAMLTAAALSLSSPAAFAQAAPSWAITAPDPERLDLAKDVIRLAYPPEARAAMFNETISAIMAQVDAAYIQSNGGPKDAQVEAIVQKHLQAIRAKGNILMKDYSPKLFDAISRAYARNYNYDELQQIKIFVSTPVGAKLLSQSAKMLSDPDVAAANMTYMTNVMALMQPMQDALRADLMAYFAKQKPDGTRK